MTRARLIKPGYFLNEQLAELPYPARILFAGLWCIADREGRLEDRPKRIKHEALPYDDEDVDALLASLHEAGFVVRYTVDGARYIQVVNFRKHQSPHIHEAASVIPASGGSSCEHGTSTVRAPGKYDSRPSVPIVNPIPIAIAIESSASDASGVLTPDAAHAAGGADAPADDLSLTPDESSDLHEDGNTDGGDTDGGNGHIALPDTASRTPGNVAGNVETAPVATQAPVAKAAPPTFAPDSEPYQIACQLRDAVLAYKPDALDASKAKTGQGLQAWARKIDKIIREDRRAPPVIKQVIVYALTDNFWRSKVFNPDKLRKHFEMMDAQRRDRERDSAKGVNSHAKDQRGFTAGANRGHASGVDGDGLDKWQRYALEHPAASH